jgi:hypothetical protein
MAARSTGCAAAGVNQNVAVEITARATAAIDRINMTLDPDEAGLSAAEPLLRFAISIDHCVRHYHTLSSAATWVVSGKGGRCPLCGHYAGWPT